MDNFLPYTYVITFLKTNQRYYGVRFSKTCHPDELGKTYFSSSKLVKSLIKEYGIELFKFEIRRIFNNKQNACLWESKVLQRLDAAHSKYWLNRRNNEGNFYSRGKHTLSEETIMKIIKANTGKKRSQETKQKISKALKGIKRPSPSPETINKRAQSNTGKKHSNETKMKISEAAKNRKIPSRLGKKHSNETKMKISTANKGNRRPDLSERNRKRALLKQELKL